MLSLNEPPLASAATTCEVLVRKPDTVSEPSCTANMVTLSDAFSTPASNKVTLTNVCPPMDGNEDNVWVDVLLAVPCDTPSSKNSNV